jgi:peptidoglycan/xylan/chitin deacetylase (PgdA/CDA1 family)
MEQTLGCVCDFLKGQNELDFHVQEKTVEKADHGHLGTFSIIFDTEQISCCKYALARILNLLNTYGVPATFFVTNLMNDVYSNLIEIIIGQGHEIGLHGHWHEYLSNHPKKDQVESIQGMIRNFNADIHGANFIGRMDTNTISAMIANKLNYFVYASVNNYRLFAYRKQSNVPSLIHQPEGEIWAIPISVETYGLPWASVKRMVDSTLAKGTKSHFHHITILCHPFRDGNFRNIHATDKLFDYLLEKGLKPITIDQLTHSLSHDPVNYFEPNNINEIFRTKKPNIPRMSTTQDFFGFVPENAILIFKIFRRGHSVF